MSLQAELHEAQRETAVAQRAVERQVAHARAAGAAYCLRTLVGRNRELLKHTVLPSLATNRALQQLLAEYLETLEATF